MILNFVPSFYQLEKCGYCAMSWNGQNRKENPDSWLKSWIFCMDLQGSSGFPRFLLRLFSSELILRTSLGLRTGRRKVFLLWTNISFLCCLISLLMIDAYRLGVCESLGDVAATYTVPRIWLNTHRSLSLKSCLSMCWLLQYTVTTLS